MFFFCGAFSLSLCFYFGQVAASLSSVNHFPFNLFWSFSSVYWTVILCAFSLLLVYVCVYVRVTSLWYVFDSYVESHLLCSTFFFKCFCGFFFCYFAYCSLFFFFPYHLLWLFFPLDNLTTFSGFLFCMFLCCFFSSFKFSYRLPLLLILFCLYFFLKNWHIYKYYFSLNSLFCAKSRKQWISWTQFCALLFVFCFVLEYNFMNKRATEKGLWTFLTTHLIQTVLSADLMVNKKLCNTFLVQGSCVLDDVVK